MASQSPKLLAVDLDGTLLDHSGSPHTEDVAALQAAAKAGIHVSILTGRLYSGTRAAATALGLVGPVGCVDGSHVVNAGDHSTILHHGIKGDHASRLRDSVVRRGPTAFLFAQDAIVYDEVGALFLPYVSTWSTDLRQTQRISEHEFWGHVDGVTGVIAVGTEEQIKGVAADIEAELQDACSVAVFPVRKGVEAWGLIARAAAGTKGTALRWLADHHRCDISETVVVGDWRNDISMFQVAGTACVMGHAPDDVKAHATRILPETSAEGGGIARVVREVFGIRA